MAFIEEDPSLESDSSFAESIEGPVMDRKEVLDMKEILCSGELSTDEVFLNMRHTKAELYNKCIAKSQNGTTFNARYDSPEDAKMTNTITSLMTNQDSEEGGVLLREICELSVTGSEYLGNWDTFVIALVKMHNLNVIRWNLYQPLQQNVIDILENREPLPKLYYKMSFDLWDRYSPRYIPIKIPGEETDGDSLTKKREQIIGSRSLYSLEAKLVYGGYPNTRDMDLVTRVVTSCPNLRELDLGTRHQGGVFRGPTPRSLNFDIKGDIAPLQVVKLDRYDLDAGTEERGCVDWDRSEARWPWKLLPRFVLWLIYIFNDSSQGDWMSSWHYKSGRRVRPSNLDTWMNRMDWSRVHTLRFADVFGTNKDDFAQLGAVTTGLRNVNIDASSEACIAFLKNANSNLESVRIGAWNIDFLDRIVETLGKQSSLQDLHISVSVWPSYRNFAWSKEPPRVPISILSYPFLTSLYGDVDTGALDAPMDIDDSFALEVLASICCLGRADVHVSKDRTAKSDREKLDYDSFWTAWKKWNAERPHDSANLEEEQTMYNESILQGAGAEVVRKIFGVLKEYDRHGLSRVSFCLGPWEVAGEGGATRRRARVWRYGIDEHAGLESVEFTTTARYHEELQKGKRWAETIDEWGTRNEASIKSF